MLHPLERSSKYSKGPCPECPSSDAYVTFEDGGTKCFSCGYFIPKKKQDVDLTTQNQEDMQPAIVTPSNNSAQLSPIVMEGQPRALHDRGLSQATLEKYGVTATVGPDSKVLAHFYPYFRGPDLVAVKRRVVASKDFYWSGQQAASSLFGQQLVPAGGQYITITEGELDAMSVYEMLGFPAVSVKNATDALNNVMKEYTYLDSFENIILCLDNDEPGRKATEAIAKKFDPGKVKVFNHGTKHKDANDWLKAGESVAFKKSWWSASPYTPDNIIGSRDTWDLVRADRKVDSILYPYDGMNKKTYGIRKSELVVVTGGTGTGKSTFCRKIAVELKDAIPADENIGMLMIEETTRETAESVMSLKAGIPFHLPDAKYTIEQKERAYKELLEDNRIYFQADKMFAYSDVDDICATIKYMARGLNCTYIILDHLNIITSGTDGDERRQLDQIVTKLKSLTVQLDICIIAVCHLKRLGGTAAEEGAQISLNDLRGTHGIAQLSNIIFALERNGQSDDPTEANTITIRVLKNRFCGRLGVATRLVFDDTKMSYTEIAEPTQATDDAVKDKPKFQG